MCIEVNEKTSSYIVSVHAWAYNHIDSLWKQKANHKN